jgi:hypothetical protein
MPTTPLKSAPRSAQTRTCHWEEIQGARVKGRVSCHKIWICEYPYRTMRRDGPGADCTDCPVWHEMQEQKAREAEAEPTPRHTTPHTRS